MTIGDVGLTHHHQKKREVDINELKQEVEIDDHKIPLSECVARYQTSLENGLTRQQAKELLAKYGPNCLTPPKQTSEWVKFAAQLVGGFSLLLSIGAIL